jgi:ligand-binding sensor domain-containing protein
VYSLDDRFCSTCGATRGQPTNAPTSARRGTWLILSISVALLAVLGVVAFIYFSAPERHAETPVGRVTLRGQPALAIVPGATATAFVGATDGLLASRDRGASWQAVPSTGPITAAGASTASEGVGYLAGSGLWRIDSTGIAPVQTNLPTGDVTAIAVDPDDPRRLYAIVRSRGLLASADGGATWQLMGSGIPSDANSIALASGATARLFVGTAQHGVFASSDGQGWTNASGFVNGALPTHNVTAVAFDARSGDQYVGPSGQAASGALYAGTDIGVFKSIDSGLSWSSMPFHHPIVALAVAADGSHLMLALDSDGNVYRSQDSGNSWAP